MRVRTREVLVAPHALISTGGAVRCQRLIGKVPLVWFPLFPPLAGLFDEDDGITSDLVMSLVSGRENTRAYMGARWRTC